MDPQAAAHLAAPQPLLKLQYHVITNHEHWPFDTPEAALALAAEELAKGHSVHIYPTEVLA